MEERTFAKAAAAVRKSKEPAFVAALRASDGSKFFLPVRIYDDSVPGRIDIPVPTETTAEMFRRVFARGEAPAYGKVSFERQAFFQRGELLVVSYGEAA
jgi:hypothetical protein